MSNGLNEKTDEEIKIMNNTLTQKSSKNIMEKNMEKKQINPLDIKIEYDLNIFENLKFEDTDGIQDYQQFLNENSQSVSNYQKEILYSD